MLGGLAAGLDRVMRTVVGVKTVDVKRILPEDSFVTVPLTHVPGKVVWVNWRLLECILAADEKLDPQVRKVLVQCCRDRNLSPELNDELLHQYSVMVAPKPHRLRRVLFGEKRPKLEGYADRYYSGSYLGSGRAVIPEFRGGVFIKGSGPTPLVSAPKGGSHSDGLIGPEEAVVEAVTGEALAHLADNRTTRILTIIAPKAGRTRSGDAEPHPVIAVRVGNHLRPAHLFSPNRSENLDADVRDSALNVMYGDLGADERARVIIAGHAELMARMNRFRMLHGSTEPSNIGVGGTALDFGTATALPDTGPHFTRNNSQLRFNTLLDYKDEMNTKLFGAEHKEHASALKTVLPEYADEWKDTYRRANDIETLSGCGLKPEMAKRLLEQHAEQAQRLAKAVRRLGRWYHDPVSTNGRVGPKPRSSLVDIHRLQTALPALFFDEAGGIMEPASEEVLQCVDLQLTPQGEAKPENEEWREDLPIAKYAVVEQRREDVERSIHDGISTICDLVLRLMQLARDEGVATGVWQDERSFSASLRARAEFENRPLDALYGQAVRGKVKNAIEQYEQAGSKGAEVQFHRQLADIIESAVSDSKRCVDDMLFNTPVDQISDDGQERYRLQTQKIDGMLHYVEADRAGQRRLYVEIPVSRLTAEQRTAIDSIGEAATAEWVNAGSEASTADISVCLSPVSSEQVLMVRMEAQPYQYRTLEGELRIGGGAIVIGNGSTRYTYAVPDRQELEQLVSARLTTPLP
jgi:hypothetical protein